MVKLELTQYEITVLAKLVDAAVRGSGVNIVREAVYFMDKMDAAMAEAAKPQQQPAEQKDESNV